MAKNGGMVLIVWDIENCPVPPGRSLDSVISFLDQEFVKRPQRRRWGWYAALSPGSYKFHGGDGTNLVEKLNSRSIKVLFNTGKGKLGNTDVPLKGVIDDYIDTWVSLDKVCPAALVLVGSDADFHQEMRRGASEGIKCYRVYSRSRTARLVADDPDITNLEIEDLLSGQASAGNPGAQGSSPACAQGGDTPADTHTPQQAQQQAQHPPKKPQGVALDACLRPLKGKWIDEGPITDAILPDVEDVVTPDFEDEPGFRGAVALTYGTTPWGQKVATSFRITFKNRYTADESKYIFHREDYTLRDDTGKSKAKMETRLYVTWYKEPSNPKGNSSSSSSGGGSPDPNLEIKEVEIRTRVDGPEGALPQGFLEQEAKRLVTGRLAVQLLKVATDAGVTILPPPLNAGAPKGDTIGFANGRLVVKGAAADVEVFKERLAAHGLDGIVQTVLPFDLTDRFRMADGRPLPSDMREPARWYVAARLRKLRERLVKTFGGAGLISPSPPALMDTRLDPPSGSQPYHLVITCTRAAANAAPDAPGQSALPSRLDSALSDLRTAATKPWAANMVHAAAPKGQGASGSMRKAVEDLNYDQMGEGGRGRDVRYQITLHKATGAYLVLGQERMDVEQGCAELKEELIGINGCGVSQAPLREVAPSPAVFNLVKRSEDFKDLLLQAQHKDGVLIRAGPTHDKGSVKGRTFTVWGPVDKAERYKQKVHSLVSSRKQLISRVTLEVPPEARCLFLPSNIDETNELLRELAESKDHPVWVSLAEESVTVKGIAYPKELDAATGLTGSDGDTDSVNSGTSGGGGTRCSADPSGLDQGLELSVLEVPGRNGIVHKVTLVYGNITGARTELLVNSANGYMKHGGGVAAAIIRAAGAGVADECKALRDVSFGGKVPVGGSLLTGAGRLTGQGVRSILHVVPPVYADTEDACRAMAKAVGQVMEAIKDRGVRSVAVPMLGAGIFNWPVDESASMILAALKVGLQQQEAPVNVYMIENSAKSAEQACVAFHVFGAKAVVQPLSEAAVTAVSEIEGSARWEFFLGIHEQPYVKNTLAGVRDCPPCEVGGKRGVWYPMRTTDSKEVEAGYQAWLKHDRSATLNEVLLNTDNHRYVDGATYAIELTSMTQVNRLTKFRRSVRRWTVTSPSLPMAAAAPRPAVTSPAPAPEDLSPDRVEAAAAKKAVAQKRLNRSQVLEGPVILHIDGHRADLEKAQKRLRGEFKRLCLTEQRETPPGLRYLKKALQQQLKEEAVERDLQLELEKSPNGAWGMTCAGAREDVVGFMRIVWEPLLARELERQAQEVLYRTSYPDTWTVEAGAADDDDDGGSSSSKFSTFKLVNLFAPLPDGVEAAGASGGKTGLERLRSRCNASTWREVEFVADVWGRTMDVDLIVQITRVQNTMQYDQFDQQRKVFLQPGLQAHLPYKAGLHYDPGFNTTANKWLWHGTRTTEPHKIAEKPFFLEQCYSGDDCLWGPANYFAEKASYSAGDYRHKCPDGTSEVMLCEVLTGYAIHKNHAEQSLRSPPEISSNDPLYHAVADAPDKRYSSVSGSTKGCRVYMTYTSGSVRQYAHYIVNFRTPPPPLAQPVPPKTPPKNAGAPANVAAQSRNAPVGAAAAGATGAGASAAARPGAGQPATVAKAGTVLAKLRSQLMDLKKANTGGAGVGEEAFKTACATMLRYLGKIVANPGEDEFRSIELTTTAFQWRVAAVPGTVDFLITCGFEKTEKALTMAADKVNMDVLNGAETALDDALTNPFFGAL